MKKEFRFTFLCTEEERTVLYHLSNSLNRTKSDTIRWLIREAAKGLGIYPNEKQDPFVYKNNFMENTKEV